MFDMNEIRRRVDDGLIIAKPDPEGTGLTLYDYTARCAWDRVWDEYTLAARGLVLDGAGTVFARPFRKFFNLGEPDGQIRDGHPELFEKYDGSLIICFHDGSRWRCNTRGSWVSEQAIAASEWLLPRLDHDGLIDGFTYLFEYVAPTNRIVLRYEDERCVFLGAIDNRNGETVRPPHTSEWIGIPLAESHGVRDIADVDISGGDGKREGFVAVWPCGHRVKLKYAEYSRLHRIVTGMSVRGIWEGLSSGADELDLTGVPDEFMKWYVTERDRLRDQFARCDAKIEREWQRAIHCVNHSDRKAFAMWVQQNVRKWMLPALFHKLDGKSYDDVIWKTIKPTAATANEDTSA